ncbi:hypothetical protein [Gracilibacillus dipsosauri]|uniref:hypothetical protein n=1 Tax=Gracilibacillus dipsosauri TaxID=178340 RepID=UPI002409D109
MTVKKIDIEEMIYTGEVLLIIENAHLPLDDDLIVKLNSQLQDYVERNDLYDIDEDEGIDEIKNFFKELGHEDVEVRHCDMYEEPRDVLVFDMMDGRFHNLMESD